MTSPTRRRHPRRAVRGSGVATLVVSSLTAGPRPHRDVLGDADNDVSSGSLTQTVAAPRRPHPARAPPPRARSPKPPKVKLVASTTKASVGDKVTLQLAQQARRRVMASGDWGGAQKAKGSKKVRITERGKHVFKLTVENASGAKTAKVEVMATRKAKELELVVTEELVLVGDEVDVAADGLAKGETYTRPARRQAGPHRQGEQEGRRPAPSRSPRPPRRVPWP